MKKFSLVLMSVLTILLSSVLVACSFKKAEASFSQNEVVVSLGESVSLDDYLNVVGVNKNDVVYKFSNPSVVSLENRVATAESSGKTNVYATYQNNSLASMQIVVRKIFSTPTDFSLSETGLLTWSAVSGYFENEQNPTVAPHYVLEGTCTEYSVDDPSVVENVLEINTVVDSNSYQLTEHGVYSLTVYALGTGYFADSALSDVQTLYYGYMEQLDAEDLQWNASTGVLSWSAVAGAKYKVKMDDILLDDYQSTTTKDLSSYFDSAEAGSHTISVVVYDESAEKIAMESEEIVIEKLETPTANYVFSETEGGLVEIETDESVQKYDIVLTGDSTTTLSFENSGENIKTNLNEVETGIYNLSLVAKNETGLFYKSNSFELGKIYKMPVMTLAGIGGNEVDGTIFNAKVSANSSLVESNVLLSGLSANTVIEGLAVEELSKNIEITISQSGEYSLTAYNIARSQTNQISGEDVYVVNSDLSPVLSVVKVADFSGEISHSYVEEKSVLSFAEVNYATAYELYRWNGAEYELVDAENYSVETSESVVSIKFTDKIENLFEAVEDEGVYTFGFEVVAKTNDDTLVIGSSKTKDLTLLTAPISAGSGNSTDKTYTWNAVNNASGYRLEIYEIDKDTYNSNQEDKNIDVYELSKQEETTDSASYTFNNVGYYYVKVFALSDDNNQYISSTDCLEEVFYIAEKLVNGTVQFGYDEQYKNQTGFTASSGYFVKVENVENISSYELSIDSASNDIFKISDEEYSIYLLSENFASGDVAVNISVVGHSDDETIYNASEATVLTVERLASVTYDDLVVDELTSTLTIKEKAGITGAKIWESDGNFVDKTDGTYPVFNISNLNNFALTFSLYGTKMVDTIYQEANGKIYLDSASSILNFARLQAPSNFKYYDGDLTFEHNALSGTKYYVLDLSCDTLIGPVSISVKFDSDVVAVYEGVSVQLGSKPEFFTYSGSSLTIKLDNLIEKIKTNDLIAGIYNQATSVNFSVYAYQTAFDVSTMTLSSPYATLYSDPSKTELVVEKMGKTKLSFSNTDTNYTLSWEEVDANASIASETTYQIYMNDAPYGSEISASLSYSMASASFEDSTYYTFYVKVFNPYYLESSNSNSISIYKLDSLKKLTLTTDANLSYEIATNEQDFYDYVEVKVNSSTTENRTGQIAVSEGGSYTLKVVGKKIENEDSATYYIDSKSTTWTLAEMSALKPSDDSVSFANNLLSWNAFGETAGLGSLNYIIIFKDETGKCATYRTKDTSVNLSTNTELYDAVANLSAGNIEIGVSAYLDSYSVVAGGTIYYALDVELLNGNVEDNHYLYQSNSTIKKLTTPDVVKVEYVYSGLENAQFPNIQISFTGNYGDSGRFSIYLNDNDTPVLISNLSLSEGKYSFVLTKENYNNNIMPGETMTVKIMALSDVDIPSSEGCVDIVRAVDLKNIEFASTGSKYNQNLVISFDPEYLDCSAGGVVLQATYQATGGEVKTEYLQVQVGSVSEELTYDMSAFFEEFLPNGGSVKLSGYVNNYADDVSKIYYLAGPTVVESSLYNVLNQVENVTREEGGFSIDPSLNSLSTVYVVEYGSSRFEVVADAEGKFYFEFPNSWQNDSYDLKIYATEDGYINSVANTMNFVLNRIDSVTSVSMERDDVDMSDVTLSWNHVENASGYILKMYSRDDAERTNLLYSFNTVDFHNDNSSTMNPVNGKISYNLMEIFGNNYEDLLASGKLTAFDLLSDKDVIFELITIGGSGLNNSYSYVFNATIKGNPIQTTDIVVDEYGSITFTSEVGTTYIYRFVDSAGTAELQGWKTVEAVAGTTKLDTSNINLAGTLFNVEIIAVGSAVGEPASSADYEFVLDSMPLTTVGNDLTFIVNDEIFDVGYNEILPSSLAFTMTPNSFTKVYAGLSDDAILSEDVISFVPEEGFAGEEEMKYVYSYSFINLINDFKENGYEMNLNDNFNIYFWSYRETTDITGSYIISKAYKFTFSYVTETQFDSITKVGDLGEDSKFAEDYVNTFALFNDTDVEGSLQTLGFFVRITQISTEDETGVEQFADFSTIKFLTKEQVSSCEYFLDQSVFAINLTELFEQEDLYNLTGIFKVEFAKVQVSISTTGSDSTYKFILTDWLTSDAGKSFEFERLSAVRTLSLSAGNLYWNSNGDKTTKYYVYFIQDLIGNQLGENYHYFATKNTYFNASDFVAEQSTYYIAVQAISDDPYVLSSIRKYITNIDEGPDEPILVYKNQVNSPLKLKDGKLYIEWDKEGDFYKLLTGDELFPDIASALSTTIFTSPFTFTLEDLVNNNVTLRISFTSLDSGSEGVKKTFDINAKYLLSSLLDFGTENDFDILQRLDDLYANASVSSIKSLISSFRETIVENGSFGIANSQKLFDDLFESVQMGSYKVEYCLIGNSRTLNSSWYTFTNENNESVLYVNGEPSVKAYKIADTNDKAINSYQLIVKKSQIYDYLDGSYVSKTAENYNLKIYDDADNQYVFAITKGASNWSLSYVGEGDYGTVSVYETDISGNLVADGGYLMFYINQNNGDSILGKFGEIVGTGKTYKMQIYAVGTNYSTSSKSEFFSLTLLGFNNTFTVADGEFSWGSVNNRKTSVIYKKNTSSSETLEEVDGNMAQSKFSLENLGYGLYDYIKFVLIGEINNKSIFVDSEIYQVDNVYKLSAPTLSNNFGYISIDDSNNISMLGVDSASDPSLRNCYSDGSLYNYKLYNTDEANYIKFSDTNSASKVLYYEPGVTGIDINNPDYAYKVTEETAKEFYVVSLGTTAGLITEDDESLYYLKHLYCKDISTGEASRKSIALKSAVSNINAAMLDQVQDVIIENGILKWGEVAGRTEETPLTIPTTGGADIVYKITVVQYKESNTEDGQTETNVGVEYYYYTTETSFDFTLLKEDQIVATDDKTYLKATVQALALYVTDKVPMVDYVSLVEGGYAYGNLQYDGTETYVLMGNGSTLKSIDRLDPVNENSFEVIDGTLYWSYTVSAGITDENMFFEEYSFVVTDKNGKEIKGSFAVDSIQVDPPTQTSTFKIKFVEDAGEIESGKQMLYVYVTQGTENDGLFIKSFARTVEITKLKTVTTEDFSISSANGLETLSLEKYFADSNANNLITTIKIMTGGDVAKETTITFNRNQYNLYILRDEADSSMITIYPDKYVAQYLVISEDQTAEITFKATNSQIVNALYSDLSEKFVLQRSNWGENSKIEWDPESQTFSWNYNGYYTFKQTTTADKIRETTVLTIQTTLYNDEGLQEASEIVLDEGTEIAIEQVSELWAQIIYLGERYYIGINCFETQTVVGETETFGTSSLFSIVSNNGEKTIITFDGITNYSVDTSSIVEPVYIVEVTYGEAPNQIVRTYTTTSNTFTPSIITTQVRLKVSIKLGSTNIQSQELVYVGEDMSDYVAFDLFESGSGTQADPYKIVNAEQFKNIAYRMKKDESLINYSENGMYIEDEKQYYFSLESSLVLSEKGNAETYVDGILFTGEFDGIINGNGNTITYTSKGVSRLSQGILISEGYVLGPSTESSTTFNYGSALFEKLSGSSSISNLNIDVTYGDSGTILSTHSLVAGLAITNNGKLDNINLVGFENNFVGYVAPNTRIMMIYSGIVSKNEGGVATISNSSVKTSMIVNDGNQSQVIFVSGIAYINFATIEDCSVGGNEEENYSIYVTLQVGLSAETVQVAGVVITNSTSAILRNCSNYFDITVECTRAQNQATVYIAGVADYGKGTLEGVYNYGNITAQNVAGNNLHKGDVIVG